MTGAQQNIDFAMGFRLTSPKEILYLLGESMTGAHQNTDFAMGFRFKSQREILYVLRGFYNRNPSK